ncbi:amiloride-sensitive sodium channel domain-containing protein [Phthorimaea operculella]|nr:amiloride-sensitive sodium channel domain-containing protein [Phthorimaea operculella]
MKKRFYRAFKYFLRNTTLHGFKYFNSPHYSDRMCWIACAWAGVCCAVVLCSVVWARFQDAPLLLTRASFRPSAEWANSAPMLAVCPSPYRTAQLLADNLSLDLKELDWLPILFSKILRGKPASNFRRSRLDNLLNAHNLTLREALRDYVSPCKELLRSCMLLSGMVPCNKLFAEELSRWGACCIMRPERLEQFRTMAHHVHHKMQSTKRLDLSLDCYIRRNFDSYCCEFFIRYQDEDWLGPWYLMSGYSYTALLEYTSIRDVVKNKLVEGGCVSETLYSHSRCMIVCKETLCGCSHPLRLKEDFETHISPPCTVVQMQCLGNFIQRSSYCKCLPACERITGYMSVGSIPINENIRSFDPIYADVNSNSSIVLNIRIRLGGSKTYNLIPTQTWFTLLSSLGGVFNMFLGIGLFTVLEIIYLLAAIFLKRL